MSSLSYGLFSPVFIIIRGLFKKYPTWFYSAETNEAREVCCGREVEGTFMCIHEFFPASRQHQSRAARVWVRVYTQRASHSAKMTERLEQRYCIKFCQKLGDSQVETIQKIQRVFFGDDGMSITQIKEWYNRFKDGRTSVESDSHFGRLSTSRNDEFIDQVRTLFMQDRHVTVRELTEAVGISTGSVHSISTDNLFFGECPRNSCWSWFKLSWPNTTFLWFNRHSTLLTWLLAIICWSPTWKRSWKGLDLSHEMTFSQKITMRRALRLHPHSHAGCPRLMLSTGGKKSIYAQEGTFHLPITAHLPCLISFSGKNHVGYFLNSPFIRTFIIVLFDTGTNFPAVIWNVLLVEVMTKMRQRWNGSADPTHPESQTASRTLSTCKKFTET